MTIEKDFNQITPLTLPFIRIPDYLVKLSKIRSLSKTEYHEELSHLFKKHRDFRLIVEKMHPEIAPGPSKIREIYERYGKEHFLDLSLATMVQKKKTHNYLHEANIKPSSPILEFVDELRPYTISENTRLHLFGYYLHTASFSKSNDFLLDNNHPLNFTVELNPIFELFKSNILEIDYFIIIIHFLFRKIPMENLQEMIHNRSPYIDFYRMLSKNDQVKLQSNLLNYANSIHETYYFYQQVI